MSFFSDSHIIFRAFVKAGHTAQPPVLQFYAPYFDFGKLLAVGKAKQCHHMCQLPTTGRGGLECDVEIGAEGGEKDDCD